MSRRPGWQHLAANHSGTHGHRHAAVDLHSLHAGLFHTANPLKTAVVIHGIIAVDDSHPHRARIVDPTAPESMPLYVVDVDGWCIATDGEHIWWHIIGIYRGDTTWFRDIDVNSLQRGAVRKAIVIYQEGRGNQLEIKGRRCEIGRAYRRENLECGGRTFEIVDISGIHGE